MNDNPEHWSAYVLMLKEQARQREERRVQIKAECLRLFHIAISADMLKHHAIQMGASMEIVFRFGIIARKRYQASLEAEVA